MSNKGKKACSEERRELIFHEVRANSSRTLSSRYEVVDIKVNEEAFRLISDGKRLADSQPVVTLTWDSSPQQPFSLVCVVEQYSSRSNLFSVIVSELLKHENRELLYITETIYSKFNARITEVHDNPVTFCLLSQNECSNADIEDTFRNLVATFTNERVHVEVKRRVQQTEEPSRTSEEFSMSFDLSSPKLKPAITTMASGAAIRTLSGAGESGIDDTDRQLQEIENSLKLNRKSMEKKIQEQRMQNSQMEDTLRMLLQRIEEDIPNQSLQSPRPPSEESGKILSRRKEDHQLTRNTDPQEESKEHKHQPMSSRREGHHTDSYSKHDVVDGEVKRHIAVQSRVLEGQYRHVDDIGEGQELVSSQLRSRGTPTVNAGMASQAHGEHRGTRNNDSEAKNRNKASEQFNSSGQKPDNKDSLTQREHEEPINIDRDNVPEGRRNMSSHKDTSREDMWTANHHQTYAKRTFLHENVPEFDMDQYKDNQRMKEDFEMMHSMSAGSLPRATSMHTVFCLDTSASMGEDGLMEMKRIASSIVDGMEEIATDHGIEENLAVVQFGGEPIVALTLTNDFGMVRETIDKLQLGGLSPLNEAILMCLQTLWGQGGAFNVHGVHVVPPRLIIITDGKISTQTEGSIDVDKADPQAKLRLLSTISQLADRDDSGVPNPLVWIPAGKPDENFLESLGKRRNCILAKSLTDRTRLCSYQRIQMAIGQLFVYIQNMPPREVVDFYENADILLGAIVSDLNEEEKREVIEAVKAKLDGEKGSGNPGPSANDFGNIYEEPNHKCPLGTRVKRGPDWMWKDQDTNGTGTVINHGRSGSSKEGYLWVEWDNGSYNKYRFGIDGAYDVWEVRDQFRNSSTDMSIQVGCEVTRGSDWKAEHGDEDGGCKGVGVVIRNNESGLIKVRWKENGFIGQYRYFEGGIKEVFIRDPLDCFRSLHQPTGTIAETDTDQSQTRSNTKVKKPRWVWKWKDETDRWHRYSEDTSSKIEQQYLKRRGSCLITKADGKSYRVLFNKMTERDQHSKHRVVDRIDLNAE